MPEGERLLNLEIAGELFSGALPDAEADLRSMISDLGKDIASQLARLRDAYETMEAKEAQWQTHQMKGAVSSFGLARCGAILNVLEHNWANLPAPRRETFIAAAESAFQEGLAALLARYPFLRQG